MTCPVFWVEPAFFLLFGLFHLHRIWGLADRRGYASFWLNVLENRGPLYWLLMAVLICLCASGLFLFFRSRGRGPKRYWIYLAGGGYVLFDLFAIAVGLRPWLALLRWMFDVNNSMWNWLWGGFALMGLFCFLYGVFLLKTKCRKS